MPAPIIKFSALVIELPNWTPRTNCSTFKSALAILPVIRSASGARMRTTVKLLALLTALGCSSQPIISLPAIAADSPKRWVVPEVDALAKNPWGQTVRYGRALIVNTASMIGPHAADPKHRFSGNNLSCQNCHLEAGTKEFGLPFRGVYASFPTYRARSGKVDTIEARIQGCMLRSMNGKPLPSDGAEMTAIIAYLNFLSTGVVVGAQTRGRGAGSIAELSRPANPMHGRQIFAAKCAVCHGAKGEGQRAGNDASGYTVPPLWGPDSFNDGAGMDRLINAANFIHSNMPDGATWRQPALSVDDAWDVAAFVISQPRPHMAHLDHDFPNRLEKPVDAAYGPFADSFSPRQHKYGPFAPIRTALLKLRKHR